MENETRPILHVYILDDGETDMINDLPGLEYSGNYRNGGYVNGGWSFNSVSLLETVREHNFRIAYEVPERLKHNKSYRSLTRAEILLLETWMLKGEPSMQDFFALRRMLYVDKPQTYGQALFELADTLGTTNLDNRTNQS